MYFNFCLFIHMQYLIRGFTSIHSRLKISFSYIKHNINSLFIIIDNIHILCVRENAWAKDYILCVYGLAQDGDGWWIKHDNVSRVHIPKARQSAWIHIRVKTGWTSWKSFEKYIDILFLHFIPVTFIYSYGRFNYFYIRSILYRCIYTRTYILILKHNKCPITLILYSVTCHINIFE